MRTYITEGPAVPANHENTARDVQAILAGRLTIDVPTAALVLGIGRRQAYEAAHDGRIPTLRMGKRILVPVPKLLAMLGVVSASQVA